MAGQQQPVRPWFRLASMAPRPTPSPTPTPAPTPIIQADPVPQPRPAFLRPTFSQTFRLPVGQPQPTQPQETAPPPLAPVTAPLPPATAPPPPIVAPAAPRSPPTAAPTPTPPRSPPVATNTAPPARSPPLPTAPAAPARSPPVAAAPPPRSPYVSQTPATTISMFVPTSPIAKQSTSSPSLSSPPAPKASPISTILQFVSSSSVPKSPKPKVSSPSSSLANSPVAKPKSTSPAPLALSLLPTAAATTVPTIATAREATPTSSPNIIKPSSSPNIKPISHPPSPLTLPPAQIKSDNERDIKIPAEAEQKTMLVQETKENPKPSPKSSNGDRLQKYVGETSIHSYPHNGKREVIKDVGTKAKGNHKKSSDSEDFGMRVITIAGENKGAIMELSPSRKKHDFGNNPHSLQKRGNPKAWSGGDKSSSDSGSSNEQGQSKKDKSHAMSKLPMTAFMNSNVQGVNNSIIYNVSCTHHDPGVHLSLGKANGGRGFHIKDHVSRD